MKANQKIFYIWIFIYILFGGIFDQVLLSSDSLSSSISIIDSCDFGSIPGVVYWTEEREISLLKLAAYGAPIFWFSPDEPLMDSRKGKSIRIPQELPFEKTIQAPVVYYQYDQILQREDAIGSAYITHESDKNNSIIDLHYVSGLKIRYFAYFTHDIGLGGHLHDNEPVVFKLFVVRSNELSEKFSTAHCQKLYYVIGISKVTAEAHGLEWYYNILVVDNFTKLPIYVLVEEGKHGLCTDKNGDGYYTPGYDVSIRLNDAWGVRDIISQGPLFSGQYQPWMSKVRRKEHRVFPPLPADSPLRVEYQNEGVYAAENAIYELRAYPSSDLAYNDPLLRASMRSKEIKNWPLVQTNTDLRRFEDWLKEGLTLRSFAVSLYTDGHLGVSVGFPFFMVKNFEDPLAHGYLTHRLFLRKKGLKDFGWLVQYSSSASRWLDNYFAAGAELFQLRDDQNMTKMKTYLVVETGVKFRVNLQFTPLKFLSPIMQFWGFRAGVKNRGFFEINNLTYVFELGAGVW